MNFDPFPQRHTGAIRTIIESAAYEHSADVDLFLSTRRRPIVYAKFVAMHVARRMTKASYPTLARIFRKKNHTSVLHACRRAEELLATNEWAQDYAKRIARRADRILLEQAAVRR